MAIPAGRKGVKSSQVDWQGNVIGGGGGSTLAPRVTKLEGQIKTFEFRDNDGTPQYRSSSSGEWTNFNNGGGLGMHLTNPTTEGLNFTNDVTIIDGGYQKENGIVYVDITLNIKPASFIADNYIGNGFPHNSTRTVYLQGYGSSDVMSIYVETSGNIRVNNVGNSSQNYRIIAQYLGN